MARPTTRRGRRLRRLAAALVAAAVAVLLVGAAWAESDEELLAQATALSSPQQADCADWRRADGRVRQAWSEGAAEGAADRLAVRAPHLGLPVERLPDAVEVKRHIDAACSRADGPLLPVLVDLLDRRLAASG